MSATSYPPSDSVEQRLTRIEVGMQMLQKEFVEDRHEKNQAITENSRALSAVGDAVNALTAELRKERHDRERHDSITSEKIDSLWERMSKTSAGKAGLSAAMAGIGIFVLKIIEALPSILSLAQAGQK